MEVCGIKLVIGNYVVVHYQGIFMASGRYPQGGFRIYNNGCGFMSFAL